jgi:hypothetical protein
VRHDILNADPASLCKQRPAWLDNAHRKLDAAVFAAYGWPVDLSDDEILAHLLIRCATVGSGFSNIRGLSRCAG